MLRTWPAGAQSKARGSHPPAPCAGPSSASSLATANCAVLNVLPARDPIWRFSVRLRRIWVARGRGGELTDCGNLCASLPAMHNSLHLPHTPLDAGAHHSPQHLQHHPPGRCPRPGTRRRWSPPRRPRPRPAGGARRAPAAPPRARRLLRGHPRHPPHRRRRPGWPRPARTCARPWQTPGSGGRVGARVLEGPSCCKQVQGRAGPEPCLTPHPPLFCCLSSPPHPPPQPPTCSSYVSLVTSRYTVTSLSCPMRWQRAMACGGSGAV